MCPAAGRLRLSDQPLDAGQDGILAHASIRTRMAESVATTLSPLPRGTGFDSPVIMQFAARLAPVDRVWIGQIAPFSARTLMESTTARDQWIRRSLPSRSRIALVQPQPEPRPWSTA
jgi:hypothetical protein